MYCYYKIFYYEKIFLFLAFIILSNNLQAQERPKLVVGIVVDQNENGIFVSFFSMIFPQRI
jgi:hypothetical protein